MTSRQAGQYDASLPTRLFYLLLSQKEIKWIKDLIKRNPHITLNEIWYKLKINKGYTRKPSSLYRVLRKIGYYNNPEIKGTSRKHNQEYHTPKEIGKNGK